MTNCPKCGAEVDDLATVCPNCGTQIESKPSSQDAPLETEDTSSPPPKVSKPKKQPFSSPALDVTKRPQAATIATILLIIGGVLMVLYGIPYVIGASQGGVTITSTGNTTITTITNSTTATFTSTISSSSIPGSVLAELGIPYLLAGIASLFAGYGFLKRMAVAYRIALVVSIFGIVQFFLLESLYNVAIGAATLYFQTRPPVRAWLKGMTSVAEAAKK